MTLDPYTPPRSGPGAVSTAPRPFWVHLTLFGLGSRGMAWTMVWLCLALGLAGALYGFVDPRGWYAVAFLAAALPYWLAIRWVDRHGRWD
jgi:hypothetical protein